jgi:hypothetical protein
MQKSKVIIVGIIYSLVAVNSYAKCRALDIPKATIRPQIQSPEDEVKLSDLVWQDHTEMPKDAIKAIKKFFPYAESTSYSFFDLNNDGVDEIIFKNSDHSGSGGQGFSILEKQNGHWKEILQTSGGFIINNLNTPNGYNHRYNTLTHWHRYGAYETVQYLLAYKNHKYQIVSEQPVPVTVLYSKDFQKMILDINWMCWDFWN